jgi:PTH1 family peptidyl-tRNA hydrolase
LKDIITRMGTDKIARTRMGIGRPPGRMSASDYVLQTFMGDDAIIAAQLADRAADAIETWLLSADIEWTMSQHNNTDVNQPRIGVARPKVKPPQSEGQQG